jgi:maleate isomerase
LFGWRGKIGLVKPTLRGKAFAFWFLNAPAGIEVLPTYVGYTRSDREAFDRGIERIGELVQELVAAGANVICVSGGPPFLMRGRAFESSWLKQLEEEAGCPLIGPLAPHADALHHLEARRVLAATYYKPELNELLREYLREAGLDAAVAPLGGDSTEEMSAIPLGALDEVSWEVVYRHCRDAFRSAGGRFDAIYIHGAGWDAERAVEPLEQDLGIPVVFGPAADMWATYRALGVELRVPSAGRLLRQ